MKMIKTLLTGASLLLALGAQAQVNIYLTGATAFRSQSYSIIRGLYDSGFAQNPPVNLVGGTDKSANSNLVTWTGTISALFPGQTVSVYANYNGAIAGIQNLTQGTSATFVSTNVGNYTTMVTNTANFAFSSVYQVSSPYTTPVLQDLIFGATPVLWLKSVNSPASLTNITSQQVKELLQNGYLPASYFTGNTNDFTNNIYFITRDYTAGQRVIAFRDAGFTGSPVAFVNNGTNWIEDLTGQTSTTTIDTQLNKYGPAISYLTGTDAITVTNGSILSYNGVFPFTGTSLSSVSNNYAPLITGQYSLWGYEHLLSPQGTSGNSYKFLTNLQASLVSFLTTYPYSIQTNLLQVSRNADGGLVSPN
jgi:hypothetical protein